MSFTRRVECFVCRQCGEKVTGNGYTNHCPRCLWSKHIDIEPGDRAGQCKGMMEPVELLMKKGWYRIVHKCARCGAKRQNITARNDDANALARIASRDKI